MFVGHHRPGADRQRAHHRGHLRPDRLHRRLRRPTRSAPSSPSSPPRSSAAPQRRVLLHPGRHRPDPDPGREHRLQRLPAAGLDPGPAPLPAPPTAHPRRPAGLLQRHRRPGGGRRRADLRVRRLRHPPHPPLHPGRVHLLHALPDRHGPALEPGPAHRARPGARRRHPPRPRPSTPSAPCSPAWCWSIVLATKFTQGAYLAVHRRAACCSDDARHPPPLRPHRAPNSPSPTRGGIVLPRRVHAVVLVSRMHRPTLRALAYARATRPDTLEALTVAVDRDETAALHGRSGSERGIQVPLTMLDSPYREITRPVVGLRRSIRRDQPPRPGRRLHPRVRRRPLVGEPAAQPVRPAGSRAGCCSRPASWSSACPGS